MRRLLPAAPPISLLTVSVLLSMLGELHAEPAASDLAAAQNLFDEGMRLMQAHDFSQACPKLEASQKLLPGVGTQFNLGECYENTGRIASAWANFRAAADVSQRRGDVAREKTARERADRLIARLSYIIVYVSEPAPGTAVKRELVESGTKHEAVNIPPGGWGEALPVDIGVYGVEAGATGRLPFHAQIDVQKEGTRYQVVVPPLPYENVPQRLKDPNPNPPGGISRKTWELVAGGVGVVALSVGASLVISAKHTYSKSDPECNADACSDLGLSYRRSAIHRANWASLPIAIGLAGTGAAAWLWFTDSARAKHRQPEVGLMLSPAQCGIAGRF